MARRKICQSTLVQEIIQNFILHHVPPVVKSIAMEDNAQPVLCGEQLLSEAQYIQTVSENNQIVAHQPSSHPTHCSSETNKLLGVFITSLWDLPMPEVDQKSKIYHPLTSILSNPFPVDTEEDVILYSTIYLVLPLIQILQSTYPELTFSVKTENTQPVHIRLPSGQVKKTFTRQDLVLEAARNGSWGKCIILIMEYKSSGTLRRNDWLDKIEDIGGGTLIGNGRLIGLQIRKYLTSSGFPIVTTYDGSA